MGFRGVANRYITLLLCGVLLGSCEPTPSSYGYGSESSGVTSEEGTGESTDDGTGGTSGTDSDSGSDNSTVISISALKSYYSGSTTRITTTISITGVVVANDIRGEYDETIVLDDGSGGIEVAISNEPLYYNYPLGSTVVCRCDDLYIGSNYGVLRLGAAPSGDDVVSVLEDSQLSKIYFSSTTTSAIPTTVKIADLTTNLVTRFVRIEGVQFVNGGVNFCERDSETGKCVSTSHTIRDSWGNEIELYVPYSVEYGDMTTPTGWVNINGILTPKIGSSYGLRQSDYGIDF